MSEVTQEMIEAGQGAVIREGSWTSISVRAVYLAMRALDPEYVRMRKYARHHDDCGLNRWDHCSTTECTCGLWDVMDWFAQTQSQAQDESNG